ncbi:MAG: Na/Pi cotransporter family protein [Candidatus Omnitrophica bacterium]|nr:Na/Pi cotransporter family protein [Candidatus Omnitrophota bacterium]
MDIQGIRVEALAMADKIHEMLELIQKGFMENKLEILTKAMEKERELNDSEKALTKKVLELSVPNKSENLRKDLLVLEQMIVTFERMGDEASNLVERIEIKVSERLLFSEKGVEEFNETYGAMQKSVDMMRRFLKGGDTTLKDRIIDNGFHVKELVERYRKDHTDRLLSGLCTPMAANMFFDMLDYTGNLARHASNVVKLF